MIATYHRTARYHGLPLVQMQNGQQLLEAGGPFAEAGQRFIDWALEDLAAYGQQVYDAEQQVFRSMLTDGTPLRWQEVSDGDGGYYLAHQDGLMPIGPNGQIFWGYALAYRLSGDPVHWRMSREIAKVLGFGDLGAPDGRGRALAGADALDATLRRRTRQDDWRPLHHSLYALLELHEATGDPALLRTAARVGDALLERQVDTGLFPRPRREHARTGDEVPLAILHLAAAIRGDRDRLPRPMADNSFFHVRYDGPLEPHQQKPGDRRTYDHLVWYGR